MAYRFRRKESAATGFRRITRELTAVSVSLLADRGNDLGNRVHEARRQIKRLRALLRLAQDAMDPNIFAAEDDALQSAGQRLATARDADICLATFEALTRRLPKASHQEIRAVFEARVRFARRSVTRAKLATLAVGVRNCGLKVAGANLDADGWKLIRGGLGCSLAKARKLRSALNEAPKDATLHEWRKWLKRLCFQMELLRSFLPKAQRKMARKLEQLCDLLGKHHDLHVLEQRLRDLPAGQRRSAEAEQVAQLSQKGRKLLLRRMRKLRGGIFRQKTKCVLQRIHATWKSRKT
jgi:CHAD domain-containing protein